MSDALRILAVFALVAGNAYFVIGEYSIITARRVALTGRSGAGARAALRLMISTTQVGITGIAILTGAVGEPLVRDLLGDGIPTWLSFVIAVAVVTYLSVVVGELVPKALTAAGSTLDTAGRAGVRVLVITNLRDGSCRYSASSVRTGSCRPL